MNLDAPERFGEVDRCDALADVEASAQQWEHARELAGERVDLDGADAVVGAGMGGSGIAADVVALLAADALPLPVVVHKGYGLPRFAGPRTLV
nr:mannose-6-phosphate isomerase [Euzebyales bacterium]